MTSRSKSKAFWENVGSLAVAILIVLMIRSSIFEPFKIPSGSMIPTLLVGDHIFVNKLSYGLKVPLLEWILDEPVYIYQMDGPERGDIIVFVKPKYHSSEDTIHFIKRVIGLPGDVIQIRNKVLYVNDKVVPQEDIQGDRADEIFETFIDQDRGQHDGNPITSLRDKYRRQNIKLYDEFIDDNRHVMMIQADKFLSEDYGPIQVPPNKYFVMGDNRDDSNDSRYWGFVPMDNIKGKAFVIWLSLWIDFSKEYFAFRPGRIGTLLE